MSNNRPLPSSFDGDRDFYEENPLQKLTRRLKEEPLVPFGCLLTVAALYGATKSIRAGDHNRANRMFRARIYAQGFTLAALVVGSMYWKTDRQKRKEFDAVVLERKAKEKNEAWIRELEARDAEEKQFQAMREARMKAMAEGRESSGRGGPVASSMVDERERRVGTLEMVAEMVYGKRR